MKSVIFEVRLVKFIFDLSGLSPHMIEQKLILFK
jgi:hypothetical protein